MREREREGEREREVHKPKYPKQMTKNKVQKMNK